MKALRILMFLAIGIGLGPAAVAVAGPSPMPPDAKVYIIWPQDGQVIQGGHRPRGGHGHGLDDEDDIDTFGGQAAADGQPVIPRGDLEDGGGIQRAGRSQLVGH